MKKDVMISISGRQIFEGTDEDTIEFMTDGRYYNRAGKYYIIYKESELTGLSGMTTLKVEPERVTLIRSMPCETQMIFEKGKKHVALYETGQGALTISINTEDIQNTLTESGGTLKVKYAIEIEHAVAGVNSLVISIKENTKNDNLEHAN